MGQLPTVQKGIQSFLEAETSCEQNEEDSEAFDKLQEAKYHNVVNVRTFVPCYIQLPNFKNDRMNSRETLWGMVYWTLQLTILNHRI